MGAVLFVWLGSGILMLLPKPTPAAVTSETPAAIDYLKLRISPSEAVKRLRYRTGMDSRVERMSMVPVLGRMIYAIQVGNKGVHLVDAGTGNVVSITRERAARIARTGTRDKLGVAKISRLDQHTFAYRWGSLPVYRVQFDDRAGTIAYVSVQTGEVEYTDRFKQVWGSLIDVHQFAQLNIVFQDEEVSGRLLLAAGIATLGVVATGYYLALTPRRKRKPRE